ncbi:unnamed protein product [Phaedon cochleariae]|uniref:Uncharacterized protein n=1 Tax=Phaedon cochleariae TaxID=80249 RepID=A0A9N9X227_PHACE|nr:unnamed protein product [Phaedon cochleariae]
MRHVGECDMPGRFRACLEAHTAELETERAIYELSEVTKNCAITTVLSNLHGRSASRENVSYIHQKSRFTDDDVPPPPSPPHVAAVHRRQGSLEKGRRGSKEREPALGGGGKETFITGSFEVPVQKNQWSSERELGGKETFITVSAFVLCAKED